MPSNATEASKAKKPTMEELDGQVAQIRQELSELTNMLEQGGAAKANEISDQAKLTARRLADKSQEALAALNDEAGKLEAGLMLQVRKKPLASIGIAAGVGFLAAFLMRK